MEGYGAGEAVSAEVFYTIPSLVVDRRGEVTTNPPSYQNILYRDRGYGPEEVGPLGEIDDFHDKQWWIDYHDALKELY